MNAERLAEIRKFAVETIPDILKQKREPQTERALFSTGPALLELIDALTAERARAEKAVELAREMFNAAGQAPGYEYEWREWATTLKELSNKLMETGTVHAPKPGAAEGDNLDAMLKLHLANQRSLTNEEHQHLTQFLRSIREESAKGPADQSNHADLVKTEPLYGWANKRIEMLEAENKRIKELEAEVARFKDVTQEGASLETLRTQRDKAAKYDSVCEQFPYMPGAVVWILQDGVIQRATVWRIGERVARVLLDEIAIDVDPSRLHYTADACRAAIPVEE